MKHIHVCPIFMHTKTHKNAVSFLNLIQFCPNVRAAIETNYVCSVCVRATQTPMEWHLYLSSFNCFRLSRFSGTIASMRTPPSTCVQIHEFKKETRETLKRPPHPAHYFRIFFYAKHRKQWQRPAASRFNAIRMM